MILKQDPETGFWDQLEDSEYRLVTHHQNACKGEVCNIHSRPEKYHHLKLNWRADRGLLEQLCSCGIGHPAPGTERFLPWYEFVHGCCGCCTDWYAYIPER